MWPWLRITVIWCNFRNRKNDEGVARSFVEDFLQEPFFIDVYFVNRFISFGLRDRLSQIPPPRDEWVGVGSFVMLVIVLIAEPLKVVVEVEQKGLSCDLSLLGKSRRSGSSISRQRIHRLFCGRLLLGRLCFNIL